MSCGNNALMWLVTISHLRFVHNSDSGTVHGIGHAVLLPRTQMNYDDMSVLVAGSDASFTPHQPHYLQPLVRQGRGGARLREHKVSEAKLAGGGELSQLCALRQ